MLPSYQRRIDAVIRQVYPVGRVEIHATTIGEAKQHLANIRLIQREIRFVKKDVTAEKRGIQASASVQKAHVGSGLGNLAFAAAFGRKASGRLHTAERAAIREHELQVLAPYVATERAIDVQLLELDRAKAEIERWLSSDAARPRPDR